uniref:Uncharacterized protein n=1 Tax=Meloidogyne enterolobii TaxID=390850 RepID=A0A6V7UZP3_MELEN|nr:unnamed protein product [Meloidogyne enterolobii]
MNFLNNSSQQKICDEFEQIIPMQLNEQQQQINNNNNNNYSKQINNCQQTFNQHIQHQQRTWNTLFSYFTA